MNQRSRPHLRTASTVPAILHNMAHILGNSLYKSLLKVVLIPLYQMSSFAHAAEIIESMNMTVQPVHCFHVVAGFCIDIVNSKGCRCVPARCRYFFGKMWLKVRAGVAVWGGLCILLLLQAVWSDFTISIGQISEYHSVKFDKSNPSDFIRINHTTSSKKLENEG